MSVWYKQHGCGKQMNGRELWTIELLVSWVKIPDHQGSGGLKDPMHGWKADICIATLAPLFSNLVMAHELGMPLTVFFCSQQGTTL